MKKLIIIGLLATVGLALPSFGFNHLGKRMEWADQAREAMKRGEQKAISRQAEFMQIVELGGTKALAKGLCDPILKNSAIEGISSAWTRTGHMSRSDRIHEHGSLLSDVMVNDVMVKRFNLKQIETLGACNALEGLGINLKNAAEIKAVKATWDTALEDLYDHYRTAFDAQQNEAASKIKRLLRKNLDKANAIKSVQQTKDNYAAALKAVGELMRD